MGYGAVKYADLKNHRSTNYRFSYDDMLALQVGVRYMYGHRRAVTWLPCPRVVPPASP